jgi:hypothetical protein
MGKRSGVIDDEEDLAKLSLAELDSEIDRWMRLKLASTSQLRKSFESRIHWLERFRAKHHSDVCE